MRALLSYRTIISCLIAGSIFSCSPAKKMMREASVYENGGLRQDAFEKYEQVYRGWNRADAKVGMKRMAESIANEKSAIARMSCLAGNYELALGQYSEAIEYVNAMRDVGLPEPTSLEEAQRACRNDYIAQLYDRAESLVLEEQYDKGYELIKKIFQLDRHNQKAVYLEMMCDIMPNYRAGLKAMELEKWREAYYFFHEVEKVDPDFKDVLANAKQCKSNASYTLAYIAIHRSEMDPSLEAAMSSSVQSAILNLKDPFIVMIDRENLAQVLNEQQQSMTAAFDDKTALEAGKLLGSRYIITGEFLSFRHLLSPQKTTEARGFLGKNTYDKKVKYEVSEKKRTVQISFRYRLLDAQTGQVFASEILPVNEEDVARYATFDGDYRSLYPGTWKSQVFQGRGDAVMMEQKLDLDKMFTSSREPLSEVELYSRAMRRIAEKLSVAVAQFRPPETK